MISNRSPRAVRQMEDPPNGTPRIWLTPLRWTLGSPEWVRESTRKCEHDKRALNHDGLGRDQLFCVENFQHTELREPTHSPYPAITGGRGRTGKSKVF
mmetsp:Transcript_23523/g.19747  ORF Transcript_23523/g.19747 Transcript_23523/m.19747 type:complete len:98 (-) Transcript_23523:6-299(-)